MSHKRILTALVLAGVCWMVLGGAANAFAQDVEPSQESACRNCHETRYWLYDTGKWYCQCGKQGTCTVCHGGDDTIWDEELAHMGVMNNPIAENPGVCQNCHPDDSEARIERFAAVAGFDPHATPCPTCTPYSPVSLESNNVQTLPALQADPMKEWRLAALSIVGAAFIGVILFGFRCWKTDCLSKTIQS